MFRVNGFVGIPIVMGTMVDAIARLAITKVSCTLLRLKQRIIFVSLAGNKYKSQCTKGIPRSQTEKQTSSNDALFVKDISSNSTNHAIRS